MVREGRALGKAGRPARVLDVDRVVERQRGHARGDRVAVGLAGAELVPLGTVDEDGPLERVDRARDLVDHRRVVAGLERAGAEQQPHAGLAQHVLELVRAIGRVDVDEDRSDLRGGVLHDHPLDAVGRPDPDAVAGADPGAQEPGRRGVDRRVELRVGQAHVLVAADERGAVGEAGRRALEVDADGVAEQRRLGGAVAVGRSGHGRIVHPPPTCGRASAPLGSPPMSTTEQPTTADDVKAIVDEHDIRFIRFWFTDILGQLKSFSINAAELDDAFEGGMGFDGSSITGFNAIEESDMIAMPDASTFAVLPWRPDEQGVARMFCDILTPERTPYEGDPAPRPAPSARARERDGLRHLQRRPRARVLPVQGQELDRGPRRGRLLRPHHARRRLRRAPRDGARARAARHPRRVHPPRGRAQPARDRHALRRRAEDGRRLHDLPHHGQGVRHEVRLACDVHAQAALRRERLGDAHPHEPVQRGQERDVRRRRRLLPLRRRQGVHRRPAQARARDLLDLRPVGELLQAPRARASRRRSTSLGRGATARRSCACRSTTRARSRRRAWSCAARTRRATRT